MKFILSFLLLTFSYTVLAQQAPEHIGKYTKKIETSEGVTFEYNLTLNHNGTFLFHYFDDKDAKYDVLNKNGKGKNQYGKGTWISNGKVISLKAIESIDIDKTHTLNLNKSKGRYITKSPRDKSDRVIEDAILIYDSGIPWVKRLKLIKTNKKED
ncbi:MAG: hypothetical protein EX254_03125 [Flavobacteriaceae bacterium]|nr:MAG: hypothetical protein EX254_03125 [Flavobacteriaceae bacterium]